MRSWVKLKYCSNTLRTRAARSSMGCQVTRPAGISISATATASAEGSSTRRARRSRCTPSDSANAAAPAISPGTDAAMEACWDMPWLNTSMAPRISIAMDVPPRL